MWRRLPSRWRRNGHGRPQRRAPGVRAGRLMRNPEINLHNGPEPSSAVMVVPSAPHYVQPLLKTPFHNRARALSQVDSFIPWAGYTTVDVFTPVEHVCSAIRNATTLYDLTPMVKYRIAGPSAQRFLNHLVTRDITKLKVGRVAYCVWCNDAGHLIDDGTI